MIKNKYSLERKHDFFKNLIVFENSVYGDDITKSNNYVASELRFRCRKFVKISDRLKKLNYSYLISSKDEIRYIYKYYACGLSYIGQSVDVYSRYTGHVTSNDCSSMLVTETAIDNNIMPIIEVIDITNKESSYQIESYWLNNVDCVNPTKYPKVYESLVKDPQQAVSVIANIDLGLQPFIFTKLLQEETIGTFLPDYLY